MNINEAFPSKYLKANDLQGREIPVVMSGIQTEVIGNDQKHVLYFQNKQKGVVLNKTNGMNIAQAYGDDTDNWFGKPVILFSVWTDFQGKSVQAIRIRPGTGGQPPAAPQRQAQTMQAPSQQPPTSNGGLPHPGLGSPPPGHPADLNDDIPF